MDVDLVLRETEELHVSEGDNAERFVDFECINSVLRNAGMLEGLGDGQGRGGGELAGLLGGVSPPHDLGNGLQVKFLQLGLGNEDDGGSAVVERGGVGGSHGAGAGDEGWLDATELIGVKLEGVQLVRF